MEIQLGDMVCIFHADEWYDEGRITKIENGEVFVDFLDWIQSWKIEELCWEYSHINMRLCLSSVCAGKRVVDFGQTSKITT